jgi:hypothetical protein
MCAIVENLKRSLMTRSQFNLVLEAKFRPLGPVWGMSFDQSEFGLKATTAGSGTLRLQPQQKI